MNTINKNELLPNHYIEVGEPSYTGKGNHSVMQLEEIAEQYKGLVHQLRLREQAILNKFSISIVSNCDDVEKVIVDRGTLQWFYNYAQKMGDADETIAIIKHLESLGCVYK